MKRVVLISIVLFMLLGAKAQQLASEPILEDGRAWKWQHVSAIFQEDNGLFMEEVVGDTIVEGKNCKLIKHTTLKTSVGSDMNYCYPAYEENGKIFIYNEGFHLVLDMSLKLGDKTPYLDFDGAPIDGFNLTVVAEDYVEVRGQVRRRLKLDAGTYVSDDEPRMYWIEGIGLNNDHSCISGYPALSGWLRQEMLECYKDGELIFTLEDFGPDAFSAVADVLVEPEQMSIYDLKGIKHDRPVKGLNIINGKLTFCR